MRLELISLTVRQRNLGELIDLALLWSRQHLFNLVILGLVGAAPCIALNWLLFTDALKPEDISRVYLFLVVLCAEVPLATAPITAYLGEAMFSRRASKRQALRHASKHLGTLVLLCMLRGVLSLTVILMLFWPLWVVEVALLERQGLGDTRRRAAALNRDSGGTNIVHMLVGVVIWLYGSLLIMSSIVYLLYLLERGSVMSFEDLFAMFNPTYSFGMQLAVWPPIFLLATVRFLGYLDQRTRREGWEIELDLRRAGQRLMPSGDDA